MAIQNTIKRKDYRRGQGRSITYYPQVCPICHEQYTSQHKASKHCGQPGCARLYKLEAAHEVVPRPEA